MRAAIGLFVVSIVGGTVLGVLVVLGISIEPNNDFWALVVALSVINAALIATFAATLPADDGSTGMRVAIGLLIVVALGATILGVRMGRDQDLEGVVLGGLVVANAALMAVFATTVPSGGTLFRRLARAPVTAAASAGIIAGGFWTAWSANHTDCFSLGWGDDCLQMGAIVIIWALTVAVMAVIGAVAWGAARALVWATDR